MIPLRLTLEGFMSYREAMTVSFDGSPLWALVGPNGAGKSALFDAITFALYGAYRGGKQHIDEVINHHADRLVVEFDFMLGGDVFRIKRTAGKRTPSSYQAWRLASGKGGPEQWLPEPQTDSRAGFDCWVDRTIGLKEKTFTAAVLLRQGKADALLEAEPRERHAMLTELLDLSVYERLQGMAKGRRDEAEADARAYSARVQATPDVSDEELARLVQQAAAAAADADRARQWRRHLAGLLVHAKTWEAQDERRRALEEKLAKARQLIAHSADIERDAARLAELATVLPSLRTLGDERARSDECRRKLIEYQDQAQRWSEQRKQAETQAAEAKEKVDGLEAAHATLHQEHTEALRTLATLASDVKELDDLARDRSQLADLDRQLASYPPDLDDQLARQERTVRELQDLRTALPWLTQCARARADWRDAAAQLDAVLARAEALAQEIKAAETEHTDRLNDLTTACHARDTWRDRAAEARTLLNQTKARLDRFHQVADKPECPYCGSELTAEHLEAERERVKEEVEAATRRQREAARALDEAAATIQRLEEGAKALKARLKDIGDQQRDQKEAERGARRQKGEAEKQAKVAFDALPEGYATRIRPEATQTVSACFAGSYPTDVELADLKQSLVPLPTLEHRLAGLQEETKERNDLRAERRSLAGRVAGAEERYPAERASRLRAEHAAAKKAEAETDAALGRVQAALDEARQRQNSAQKDEDKARKQHEEAAGRAQEEAARAGELERGIARRLDDLPESWRERGAALSREELAALEREQRSLAGADGRLEELAAARQDHARLEQDLNDTRQALDDIPEAARRPQAELDAEDLRASEAEKKADEARQKAESDRRALEDQRRQRQEWEAQRKEAARRAYLYGELARLLGRDHLQRHLLRQAEAGIVSHANDVLDHISGGILRLELRTDDGDGSKALDLVAYNRQTGQRPLNVNLLSGSQRFRVAVSLAIGIGRYAASGGRRMESVIIDEGFGSLDRAGLREMSDELHRLSTFLGRIVLVSHQEEFASCFRHKYEIRLENGSSTAVLAE